MSQKKCPSCWAPVHPDGFYNPPTRTARARTLAVTEEKLQALVAKAEHYLFSGMPSDRVALEKAIVEAKAIL